LKSWIAPRPSGRKLPDGRYDPFPIMKEKYPLVGTLTVPGDKSITHRAVILSALARGTSLIHGYLPSEDCLHTVAAFQQMGVSITSESDGSRLRVSGTGRLSEPHNIIDCGNSGTTTRLLTGLLAGQSFFSVLTGDASLRSRPMRRVVDPLRKMGGKIEGRGGGAFAPLAISGGQLVGIDYRLPIASAQVKSALLLAGLTASGITRVSEPMRSRDHTERMLRYFGVPLKEEEGWIRIEGGVELEGRPIEVPGDISSAAFFLVAGTILEGSHIHIRRVGVNPTRTGILEILKQMGARIEVTPLPETCGEPVADIVVRHGPLRATRIGGDIIPRMIDEFPILCIAAAMAEGETQIRDAAELRVKESDRIQTMADALQAMGVRVEIFPDGVSICGTGSLTGARCKTAGDHRVAMALTIAGLVADGPVEMDDTACIATSFPGFMAQLASLRGA
jgi:3-phosphoshikimate 1-carboxyvinyltransferase